MKLKKKMCLYCGEETHNRKYCCYICHKLSRVKLSSFKKCSVCGEYFVCKLDHHYKTKKYCSNKCAYRGRNMAHMVKRKKIKCLTCNKIRLVTLDLYKKGARFCSNPCKIKYQVENKIGFFNPENRVEGIKKSIERQRKYKLGFFNPKFQKEMRSRVSHESCVKAGKAGGPKSAEVNRRNGTNMFFDKKIQRKAGKVSISLHKKNKTGFFDPKFMKIVTKKSVESQRKNKTGWFDRNVQTELGLRAAKANRIYRAISWKGMYFDSKSEKEIGMCIYYQIEKLREGVNLHKRVGSREIDFFINGIFIEFHPYNHRFDGNDKNLIKYYNERRDILNENGYKNNSLVVIK